MGFNTTVVVMNDSLSAISEDPEFGKNLAAAVQGLWSSQGKVVDVGSKGHCNAATVIESHHADSKVAVLVGGNYGEVVGYVGSYANDLDNEEHRKSLVREFASRLGFDVSIKAGRQPYKPAHNVSY